jgi:hypothetical protein
MTELSASIIEPWWLRVPKCVAPAARALAGEEEGSGPARR